ncbi:PR domain zinc finger protein 10-like [Syngnathoides biaculeatus]|uniref:PR domain zinc finger protein 10-like n=1 Tax=Syngnathoides biaculeatus TaxID=300417 RepID=UPI002ADE1201|nr:PR domain zinc finger protein 10-like [Syngnathoides biaculeatus]
MDVLKIEEVIVGTNVMKTNPEMTSESSATSQLQTSEDRDDLHCPQCLITFVTTKARQNHLRRTHPDQYTRQLMQNNTLFSCYKCDRIFASPEELSVHRDVHHRTDDLPVCSSCHKVFPTFSSLFRHKRKGCVKGVWRCRDCDARCRSLLHFHMHCIDEHDRDVVPAAKSGGRLCSICWRHFLTDEALHGHQERVDNAEVKLFNGERPREDKTGKVGGKRKKRIEEETEEDDDEEDDDNEEEEEELQIPCPEADCDLVFPSVDALRAHKRSQHPPPPSSSLKKR